MDTDLEVLQDICDSYADEINRLVARNDALIANERRLLDKLQKYAEATSEAQAQADYEFKNFHQQLCERFGYGHD